jgi:ribosome-associated toxin RatA of RatAB toxin-antitoxin module
MFVKNPPSDGAIHGAIQGIESPINLPALLQGDVLLKTRPHSMWGGAVTAQIYLPLSPQQVWQKLTDYSLWTQYFPDVTHSEIIHNGFPSSFPSSLPGTAKKTVKRLYQAANKAFFLLTAKVEVYLKVLETQVLETQQQRIQFYFESGSFNDFAADLQLYPHGDGTILTYSVQATPNIPVPGAFVEQAMKMDLPTNLRQMRQVMCRLNG